jgi:hypothetical protein
LKYHATKKILKKLITILKKYNLKETINEMERIKKKKKKKRQRTHGPSPCAWL